MRVSWAEAFFAFMFGMFLATVGYALLLLRGGCTCSFGHTVSLEDVNVIANVMGLPMVAWLVGATISVIKDKYY